MTEIIEAESCVRNDSHRNENWTVNWRFICTKLTGYHEDIWGDFPYALLALPQPVSHHLFTFTRSDDIGRKNETYRFHHQGRKKSASYKCRFLQEPHGVTSQKTTFFTVTTVENLKFYIALTGSAL
jgi:hypothetical protein